MVQTGIERSIGPSFKRIIRHQRSYVHTGFIGILLAIILQSATASALLVAGFTASELLSFSSSLSIILGADIGSALIIQILSLRIEWLAPFFMTLGGWFFLRTASSHNLRQVGRIFLGIGLILMGLWLISLAIEPIRESPTLPNLAKYMESDFITPFLSGAILAFVMHSSIVAVLTCISFTATGIIPLPVSLSLILGANAGSAFLPVWLSRNMPTKARRLVFANLILRGSAACLAVSLVNLTPLGVRILGTLSSTQTLINAHIIFNVLLFMCSLPFIKPLEHILKKLLPEKISPEKTNDSLIPASALDPDVLDKPFLALASMTREVLRMGQIVELMARPIIECYAKGNMVQIDRTKKIDPHVNQTLDGIRRYISSFQRNVRSEEESRRARELLEYAINLETAGDIIAKQLLPLAEEKERKKLRFTKQGWNELQDIHERLLSNITIAFNVLVSEDIESARFLVEQKEAMAESERRNLNKHLKRLNEGLQQSFATSDLHLETLRGLKSLNSRISSIAYTILYRHGQLLETKLINKLGSANTPKAL